MEVTRQTLFASDALRIGLFQARPSTDACGDVERQDSNAIVLPVSGLFAKHEAPGRHIVGTPSHAVFFAANAPYRIGFPGAVGDRALVLRFDEGLAAEVLDRLQVGHRSHGLLSANAMILRNVLWRRLRRPEPDAFESEALGLDLLLMSLQSMNFTMPHPASSALARRRRAVERVKEAVGAAPADKWSVAKLGHAACLSPFHLSHVFRELVGTSIYDYVLTERLSLALGAVLDGAEDLTTVALDCGFASHSHFTARFRAFFGCTPSYLRRAATVRHAAELRKIVTAQRPQPA